MSRRKAGSPDGAGIVALSKPADRRVAGTSTPGRSLHYAKEQMGHASIQTTVDVYGHLVPGSNRNAVNRLDDPALRLARSSAG